MHVEKILDPGLLDKMVDEGYISVRPHKEAPLFIYNYTSAATYDQKWNEATLACRGLILDESAHVVARPFPKFFNFGETAVPPIVANDHPAQIFEKMDGSLGIIYNYKGLLGVATRGSFHSEQAEWATEHLKKLRKGDLADLFVDGVTHLCEIIYPENRIVVDYGEREDLAYLGSINHATGEDVWVERWPFGKARRHEASGIQDIIHRTNGPDHEGEEGVVMVWPKPGEPSFRLKIKRADYVEMHRIVTGMTARKVWQLAKDGVAVEAVIAQGVPEEWADWVRRKYAELVAEHARIIESAETRLYRIVSDPNVKKNNGVSVDRTKFAKIAKRWEHPGLLFALLDKKDISEKVWEMIYPPHEVPFGGR